MKVGKEREGDEEEWKEEGEERERRKKVRRQSMVRLKKKMLDGRSSFSRSIALHSCVFSLSSLAQEVRDIKKQQRR